MGLSRSGCLIEGRTPSPPTHIPSLAEALRVCALCNNARLVEGAGGEWEAQGEPTEAALAVSFFLLGNVYHVVSVDVYMGWLGLWVDGCRWVGVWVAGYVRS